MKKTKKIMTMLLAFTLVIGMTFATGCSKKSDSKETVVVTVGDQKINMSEIMFYIYTFESQIASYGQMFEQYYGTSYWDMEYSEGVTMATKAKEDVMNNAIQVAILYDKAVKAGYSLEDTEITEIETYVEQISTSLTEEQVEITGLTNEALSKILEKQIVAGKYYEELIDGFDIDDQAITDGFNYDDYRQYNTEYIFAATTTFDESYQTVDLTDEEKATALASITSALEKVDAGEELSAIVEGDTTLTTSTLNFVFGDTNAEAAYQDAAITLENDVHTSKIITTDSGYFIIKMIDNESTENYDATIESAITTAENEKFAEEYEIIKKDYVITTDEKVWEPIVMGKTTIIEASVTDVPTTDDSTTDDTTTDDSTTDDSTTDDSTTQE